MANNGASSFVQPPSPGYSPWASSRQTGQYQMVPGDQSFTDQGVASNQGFGFTPSAEFFGQGTEGTAPPSSIAPGGDAMWNRYGGSGEAPSSFAQPQNAPQQSDTGSLGPQQSWSPAATASANSTFGALMNPQPSMGQVAGTGQLPGATWNPNGAPSMGAQIRTMVQGMGLR